MTAARKEAQQYESARDAAGLVRAAPRMHASMRGPRPRNRLPGPQGEQDVRDGGRELRAGRQSRRAFFRHLRRVVASSDVVLQVLDARDPAGCRCVPVRPAPPPAAA